MKLNSKKVIPFVYLLPILILFTVLLLMPMLRVVRYSLMDNVITNKYPMFIGLENYNDILKDEVFWIATKNLLLFTVFSVLAHIILGMAFALILNSDQINSAIRALCRVLFILPWTLTVTIVAILWRLILNPNGVLNALLFNEKPIEWFGNSKTALLTIILVNIWAGYPFYMISFLAGLQGIPEDIYEAATIDGADSLTKFRYITIPHLKPIIKSMLMLDIIWTLQQMSLVWMTTGGGPIHSTETIGTYTYKLAFESMRFSKASASAIIILVFCMIICFFYVTSQGKDD